ncbi:hypothetical protein [Larkinella terrae]|nr:hypothetical protein [Larkinella terrae]
MKKQGPGFRKKVNLFEYDPNRIAFETAYKSFGRSHRQIARQEFCKIHGIQEHTFRAKLCGVQKTYEREAQWMQLFDPYTQAMA